MIAYLDNSSTTRPFGEVADRMNEINSDFYGNPSSLHNMGFAAEKIIKSSRETILRSLGAQRNDTVIFTSGGTESNNLGIMGCIKNRLKRRPQIVTTKIEHPSVLEVFKYLEELGAICNYVGVDKNGLINMDELAEVLTDSTDLLSVMMVNNEVGSIQPIDQISRMAKKINPRIIFHVDAVQAFCKVPINVTKLGIDLLSISGHKIHGPKGVGCLFIKKGIVIKPIIFGGHQQDGLRSGTQNTPAIGGLETAVNINMNNFDNKLKLLKELRTLLTDEIQKIGGCIINAQDMDSASHIVSASFAGIKSETLLHALEAREVYVSTGSACSSNRPSLSHVLLSMGLNRETIDSSIRFSLSVQTTRREIEYAIEKLNDAVLMLSM